MPEPLRHVPGDSLIAGWDFSTGGVKALAFDLNGKVAADIRLPTQLWTEGGVSELDLFQLEGQARTSVRGLLEQLDNRSASLIAGGISATHHTSGRIDAAGNQVRRAICWNDQTLGAFHARGLQRLGGAERVRQLIGGPWAERYSLSHLVKDEDTLPELGWKQTRWILSHGSLAAMHLSGATGLCSISSAASTGLMDLRTNQWRQEMLAALVRQDYRDLAWNSLPRIVMNEEPIGRVGEALIFPTLDDQAAGLVGGGATDAGHLAIILGNSAVVNSSADFIPEKTNLDVMKLNWGPYLWMRCYSNGAQFLDKVVGDRPDWAKLEAEAAAVPPGCDGTMVLPFVLSEPSLGINGPRFEWWPSQPESIGVRLRASFEALAYLIALAVREHEAAVQRITRISVSGGIAKSDLMLEILASVLNRPLERLASDEGPALGAAVAALCGLESYRRKQAGEDAPYTIADAVQQMVRFRQPVLPRHDWIEPYASRLKKFGAAVETISRK